MFTDEAIREANYVMAWQARYDEAQSVLGIDAGRRVIWRILYASDRAWSVAALARQTRIPESTIRDALVLMRRNGTVARGPNGAEMTDAGRRAALMLQVETLAIVKGEARRYSEAMIERLANMAGFRVDHDRARDIRLSVPLPSR